MNLTWVFKIIYVFIFSLIPLGLYKLFKEQTNEKIAILSCLFFVSFYVFYTEMIQLARQEIAELFLVLLILLFVNSKMNNATKSLMLVIFSFSLIVSHYGLSYIYMLLLISVFVILIFVDKPKFKKRFDLLFKSNRIEDSRSFLIENKNITLNFVLLFVVFLIGWYLYISGSDTFNTILNIGNNIAVNFISDFFNPTAAQGLSIIQSSASTPLHEVWKLLQYFTQFLIIIGIIALIFKKDKINLILNTLFFQFVVFLFCLQLL